MAKRKRLSPAQPGYLAAAPDPKPAPGGPAGAGAAPIAQVASDASAQAALQELSGVLETARAKGLMIAELPLAAIDENHLVRDRIEQDEEELQALVESIRSRGQQSPAEVVLLEGSRGGRSHGLISGWRRLMALKQLYAETSDPQFATIKALVIRPGSAEAAYVAMVEENEIRVNLSHYERARIAVRACHEGVFSRRKYALQALFGNATRAKRSKIGSFVTLVEALDMVLLHPTAISEKLGLALVRMIEADAGFAARAAQALQAAERATPEAELAVLSRLADGGAAELPKAASDVPSAPVPSAPSGPAAASPAPEPPVRRPQARGAAEDIPEPDRGQSGPAPAKGFSLHVREGMRIDYLPGERRIALSGTGVDMTLVDALHSWLKTL